MTAECITYVKGLRVGSTPQKFILTTLADRINNETCVCWPSQARIAAETDISERSVRDHLAKMEERGIIKRTRRINNQGHRTSDLYEITGFKEYLRATDVKDFAKVAAVYEQVQQILDKSVENPTGKKLPVGAAGRAAAASYRQKSVSPTGKKTSIPTGKILPGNPNKESKEKEIEAQAPVILDAVASKNGLAKKDLFKAAGVPEYQTPEQEAAGDDRAAERDRTEREFTAYQEFAREAGQTVPEHLTSGRRSEIDGLRKEFGVDAWGRAITNARQSNWHWLGRPLSFSQFVRPNFFVKVLEGEFLKADKPSADVVPLQLDVNKPDYAWHRRMEIWESRGRESWPETWGPKPGAAGCYVPQAILTEFGVEAAA
jgi:DNA-binding Lrp family transcriptional regulator